MTETPAASPARRFLVPALFVLALLAVTVLRDRPPADGPEHWRLEGATMGTTYRVVLVPSPDGADRVTVAAAVQRELEGVDAAMSTWREDSELSGFNRASAGERPVSDELLDVVAEAVEVAAATGGAFDVTVGPLVDAWGFGPAGVGEPPSEEELRRLAGVVGWRHLRVDRSAGTLAKAVDGLEVDLSAIAKGHAVDRVAEALLELGHGDLLVEVGGELRGEGHGPGGRPWRVGIERPDAAGRAAQAVIELAGAGLATSGDYRNFIVVDGQRLSHTLDPRSGRPVTHRLASVSVVAPTCRSADAWATALTVLGPEDGPEVAERHGVAALFLLRTQDGGYATRTSSGFPRILAPE